MNKLTIQNISLFVVFSCLSLLLIKIFSPYFSAIFWSIILYIICSPPYRAILKKINPEKKYFSSKKNILAGFFAITTAAIIASFLLFFVFLFIKQFIEVSESITNFLRTSKLSSFVKAFESFAQNIYEFTDGAIDIRAIDIKSMAIDVLRRYSNNIFKLGSNFLYYAGRFVISLAFVSFSLYFFYVDGDYLASLFVSAIPLETSSTKKIVVKFKDTVTQLITGLLLVSLYQAIMAFIIYSIFGLKGSFLLAILTFFASCIPFVGSGIVWFPLSLLIFFSMSKIKGIIFFATAGFFISLTDNLLRPLILKDTIKIHPFLIFFSLLGGVKFLGFKGLILGPMTIIIFFAVLDLVLNTETATLDREQEITATETASSENKSEGG